MSVQENWNSEAPAATAEVGRRILTEDDVYRVIGGGVDGVLPLAAVLGQDMASAPGSQRR